MLARSREVGSNSMYFSIHFIAEMPTLCARACVCTRRSADMEASHILVTFHVRNIENRDRITKKKIAAFSNAFFV